MFRVKPPGHHEFFHKPIRLATICCFLYYSDRSGQQHRGAVQKTGASRAVCGSAGQCGRAMAASFWLGIAAIAVRFETAGFANLGKADSIWPTVLAGPYGSLLFLLRPWA